MNDFNKLPFVIYPTIAEYIPINDYHNLLNANRSAYFLELKKKTRYWSLTDNSTLLYLTNNEFRLKVAQKIENPLKQIKLRIPAVVLKASAWSAIFDPANDEELQITLSRMTSVHTVDLEHQKLLDRAKIHDLSIFAGVDTLRLSGSSVISNIDGLHNPKKIYLYSFTHAALNFTGAINYHSLYEVVLKHCNVKDVNGLKKVHSLLLHNCHQLTPAGIQELGIDNYKISLISCPLISSISHFQGVKEIYCSFMKITEICNLRELRKLTVNSCWLLARCENLPNLQYFDPAHCPLAMYGHGLPHIPRLSHFQTPYLVKQMDSFQFLRSLTIYESISECNIDYFAQIKSLKELHIVYSARITFDVHLFHQISVLEVNSNLSFTGIFQPMPNLTRVLIDACHVLSLIGLQENKKLTHLRIQSKKLMNEQKVNEHLLLSCRYLFYQSFLFQHDDQSIFQEELFSSLAKLQESNGKTFETTQLHQKDLNDHELPQITPVRRDKYIYFKNPCNLFEHHLLNLSIFQRIYRLHISEANELTTLHGLQDIPVLWIVNCKKLVQLYPDPIRASHQQFLLILCPDVEDVSSLSRVPWVRIRDCNKVQDLRPLENCYRIDLEGDVSKIQISPSMKNRMNFLFDTHCDDAILNDSYRTDIMNEID